MPDQRAGAYSQAVGYFPEGLKIRSFAAIFDHGQMCPGDPGKPAEGFLWQFFLFS